MTTENKETLYGNIETDEDRHIDCSTRVYDCANCSLTNYGRNCRNMPIYDTKVNELKLIEMGFFSK
jgi:hypothetical protein